MNDFGFGSYYAAGSFVHRLDPRVKINLLLVLMVAMFVADSFLGLLCVCVFMLLVWWAARIPLSLVGRSILPLLFLVSFPLVLNILFHNDGTLLFSYGPLYITDRGVYLGVYMSFRLLLMFSCGILLSLTTTSLSIAYAVGEMLSPFERLGLPAYEISLMIRIALSFIPDISDSFYRIRKAQQGRGAVFDSGSPIRRVKALVPCLVPLFAQCFRNAEYLGLAMESRCFHGSSQRSFYREYRIGQNDFIAVFLVVLVLSLTVLTRFIAFSHF
ncbi:MAG: energy-coupling factor transporter transmembrane protein EcfT [Coriobacteriia bacterium]|nr:energy-coupling factor transporter transmembrane protein EcfT [Coriobacteriia bacterium]MCL2137074.1 energy-coupling factor transporter transmembrane protein EcfT [Coriobacteriia bacterium]